jgi:NTP pyrophosphatase (non-canonical NTP hydrolase)
MSDVPQNAPADLLLRLRDDLRQFAKDREWDPFHSPRNLATALSVEAAELLEHFQWGNGERLEDLNEAQRAAIRLEMADVFLYLIRLADKLNVDLVAAAHDKIVLNGVKYPVEKARGNHKKYTEL